MAIPEPASLQVKLTVTGPLRQPLALAAGLALPMMVGRVASRWMVTDFSAVPPVLVAEQVKAVPAVSAVTVLVPHPLVELTVDSGSVTVQLTVTLLVYQPFSPRVPSMLAWISGAVVSAGWVVRRKSTVLTAWLVTVVVLVSASGTYPLGVSMRTCNAPSGKLPTR